MFRNNFLLAIFWSRTLFIGHFLESPESFDTRVDFGVFKNFSRKNFCKYRAKIGCEYGDTFYLPHKKFTNPYGTSELRGEFFLNLEKSKLRNFRSNGPILGGLRYRSEIPCGFAFIFNLPEERIPTFYKKLFICC